MPWSSLFSYSRSHFFVLTLHISMNSGLSDAPPTKNPSISGAMATSHQLGLKTAGTLRYTHLAPRSSSRLHCRRR